MKQDENLSVQKIRLNIADPKLDKILNIIPQTISLDRIPARLEDDWLVLERGKYRRG